MMRKNLTDLWQKLKNMQIPPFIGLDEYDEWVEDLIEFDASIAGILFRAARGENILKSEIPNIKILLMNFERLENKIDTKYINLREAREYLYLLSDIHSKLRENAIK